MWNRVRKYDFQCIRLCAPKLKTKGPKDNLDNYMENPRRIGLLGSHEPPVGIPRSGSIFSLESTQVEIHPVNISEDHPPGGNGLLLC